MPVRPGNNVTGTEGGCSMRFNMLYPFTTLWPSRHRHVFLVLCGPLALFSRSSRAESGYHLDYIFNDATHVCGINDSNWVVGSRTSPDIISPHDVTTAALWIPARG